MAFLDSRALAGAVFLVAFLVTMIDIRLSLLQNTPVASKESDSLSIFPIRKEEHKVQAEKDEGCIFRNATIYRKVFVYPTPGQEGWEGDILSAFGKNLTQLKPWPWLAIDRQIRAEGKEHYFPLSMTAQFSTELIVRDILTHPDSCLRTMDPEEADLFYVPYLPSVEFHAGVRGKPPSHATSPYAQAILDILQKQDYRAWEELFGLSSKYWRRRKGSDHILVFSEPLQGLTHPKGKRGNYHFIRTQRQLDPPIVISVELSTTFVRMYPQCAMKNILLPYPIPDGRYYNGQAWMATKEVLRNHSLWDDSRMWTAALPAEVNLRKSDSADSRDARPFSYWLKAGIHGTCPKLRQALNRDYKCTAAFNPLRKTFGKSYLENMRMGTFCPAPGGDTASAKRMFDAILAGCIPIILSHDFVWPLSTEIETASDSNVLHPTHFSLRWNASDFEISKFDSPESCNLLNSSNHLYYSGTIEQRLRQLSASTIAKLRDGVQLAAERYSFYPLHPDMPFNPLQEGIFPSGGASKALVEALGERARGVRWPACAQELLLPRTKNDPTEFVC
jgi:hypothetical protein